MKLSIKRFPDTKNHATFFVLLVCITCPSAYVYAQHNVTDSAVQIGDSCFGEGLYQEAVTEYMRFLHFNPGHPASSAINKSASVACFFAGDMDGFIKYGRRSIMTAISEAEKKAAAFAFVEWCLAGREYEQADTELEALLGEYDDTQTMVTAAFYLGVSALYTKRWERCGMMFAEYFKRTDTFPLITEGRVLSLIEFAQKGQYRDPGFASVLSAIIPGLGQMYAGDFFQGVNSMAVNASTIALLVTALVNVRIPDAVLVYVFAFHRFYVGSSYHAKRIAREYNAQKQRMIAAGIMNLLIADP
ncbi:MAG: hypothetical protein EHM28_03180 [Spirochaetaceae bacterium]|nr:MAG: hypothetical protein EHM28_03180 [Spirochaetaceae bacterium]